MSHRELEGMEIVSNEPTAAERAAQLLAQARQQIARAKQEPSSRATEIDYGHLFKGGQVNDFSKLKPSKKQRAPKRVPLIITLDDLYHKREKPSRVVIDKLCNQCNGRKSLLDMDFTCSACSGTGDIRQTNSALDFSVPYQRVNRCESCFGKGIVVPDEHRCWQCFGEGHLSEPTIVQVPLSRFSGKLSEPLILEEQGDCGQVAGEANGNLEFELQLAANANWALVGEYFYCEKNLAIMDALMGSTWDLLLCDGITEMKCRCQEVIRDGQLIFNEEQKLMVRIRYVYPEKILTSAPTRDDWYSTDTSDPIVFHLEKVALKNYFERNWGNRRVQLIPIA